jgi:site-specific recombinase XerD
MFSAFLRIHETTIISLDGMKVEKECIWVHTILKSKQDFLTPIAIPFFVENQAICPASTVLSLIQANKSHFNKSDVSHLFFDWSSGSPLLTRNVDGLLRNLFKELKLPKEFGPYTIKHAVFTYLTNHGVKMEEINDIARFAKGSIIHKNHYAISDPQRRIHSLIGNALSLVLKRESTISSLSIPSPLSPSSVKNGIS